MEHIGIDLGSKESQICVRSASGEVLLERRGRTERLGAFLSERSPGRVIVETCTEAFRVAAAAQRAGHEVRVVAATLVRSLGVGQRGLKNDVRDARVSLLTSMGPRFLRMIPPVPPPTREVVSVAYGCGACPASSASRG